ncbi:MAG: SBBP repeat-containing protein [Vicingus serpentipes]|nr:SBBP repeat-containing protein [Vicingus serpentipes]
MRHQLTNKAILKLIVIGVVFLYQSADAQINVLWESRYTSSGQNVDKGKEIEIDANGNVYVVGTSYTSVTNGYDIVTIKYDANGVEQWVSTFNGTGSSLDEGRDIALDKNGNVYVTGYTASTGGNYDYVTIKYNTSGAQQWVRTYNGTGNGFDEAYAIVVDTNSNVYITGGSDAGGQGTNFVTIKYNTGGTQQWLSSYNGSGNSIDAATQITLDNQFNVYVAGHSFGSGTDLDFATIKYNNSGTQQWVRRFDGALNFFDVPEGIFVDNLNNVYVVGASYGGIATENDYATVKYNSSGTLQWSKIFDGPLNDEDKAFDVVVDQNQNVYVTGRSMGAGGTAENMLTIKYDLNGNLIWQDTYNGPSNGYDEAQQMRLGNSGALYVTGYSAGNGTNNDYLTLKYDTLNGSVLWEARFDGPASNSDQALAMEIDALESVYVTGASKDPASNQDFSTIKWCQLEVDAGTDEIICFGESVQLNASATGGFNYQWSPSTGLSSTGISNPIANPTVTTTYVVSAENSLGCMDYDTIIVTVNPLPVNTISASGPTTFCAGDSVTLTATNLGTYTWSPSTDTSRSIKVFSTGTHTVAIIDSNGCTNSGQQTVTVNPLPNVSVGPDLNVCNGDSVQLNATGAIIYNWNTQNRLTDSTIANPLAYPKTPTNYWVVGEDVNGCKNFDTIHIAISVSPVAKMSNSTTNDTLNLNLPQGGDIQFFSTLSTNALGFYWDFDDGGTDNVPNPIHTYKSGDDFTVMLVATNGGCSDTIYHTIFVIKGVSIEERDLNNDISVYPNPTNESLTIKFDEVRTQQVLFTVYNTLGENIHQFHSEVSKNSSIKIDASSFKQGFYFLEMEFDNQKTVRRFSVVK